MIISAPILESYDRCRRLWQYQQQWEPIRVTPLGAVYSALHQVLQADPYPGPQMAREHVLRLAGERGVETERKDPYDLMVHYGHMAEVIARVIRQPSAEPMQIHPVVNGWEPSSYLTDGGTRLMRFVLVDHWSDDRLLSELHSWRTVGDVCVTGLPMTIRVLVIGHSRLGRRHGYFTRARRHPHNKQLRFVRKHARDDGFTENWQTVWREESQIGPDAWIEQMARDGVLREVAFDKRVIVPGEYQRARVLEDIERIGDEMGDAMPNQIRGAGKFPMTRSACDMIGVGACRYQCVCLAPCEIEPGDSGMFRKRGE
jgi:hypothetical protein